MNVEGKIAAPGRVLQLNFSPNRELLVALTAKPSTLVLINPATGRIQARTALTGEPAAMSVQDRSAAVLLDGGQQPFRQAHVCNRRDRRNRTESRVIGKNKRCSEKSRRI